MTAQEALTLALRAAVDNGTPPPCAGHDGWTCDDPDLRARAAQLCTGCPILDVCRDAATGEHFHVWAGVDRTRQPPRGRAVA